MNKQKIQKQIVVNRDLFSKEVRDSQDLSESALAQYERIFKRLWNEFTAEELAAVCEGKNISAEEIEEMLVMKGHLERVLGIHAYVLWFEGKVKDWEYSTVRVNRAASVKLLPEKFPGDDGEVEKAVQRLNQITCDDTKTGRRKLSKRLGEEWNEPKETSSHKVKRIPSDVFEPMLDWLARNSHLDPIVATVTESTSRASARKRVTKGAWGVRAVKMLLAGMVFGLRPVEWAGATYEKQQGLVLITVKNAKNTNGRAHSPTRVVAAPLDHPLTEVAMAHLIDVQSYLSVPGKSIGKYTDECNQAIKKVMLDIGKKKWSGPGLAMYSGRHQFAANAKAAGCTETEIAYLMGHSSAVTAGAHYGRAVSAFTRRRNGGLAPEIIVTGDVVIESKRPPKPGYHANLNRLLSKDVKPSLGPTI